MNASVATNNAADTREKILDAAEILIIEHGYAATSLRAIASKAEVNLAATHYHFGSKIGLLAAVFHRRIHPVNTIRLAELKRLTESNRLLTTRAVIEAFFAPLVQHELPDSLPGIIGRILGEPESLTKPILEEEFAEVAKQFQDALADVLPTVDRDELRWRFHFMIGSMIQLLQIQAPLGMEPTPTIFRQGVAYLIEFAVAGLEQRSQS